MMSASDSLICYLGNQILRHKGNADIQNKILALLLRKSLESIERNDALGKIALHLSYKV